MKRGKLVAAYVVIAAGVVAVFLLTPWGLPLRNRIPLRVVSVVGDSMEPTFREGDLLLFWRGSLCLGDVVLYDCEDGLTVKRLVRVEVPPRYYTGYQSAGSMVMRADNPRITQEFEAGVDYCRGRLVAAVWRSHPENQKIVWQHEPR